MKKIMIAAAVVCAAAFAQAASINWSIANNAWSMQNGTRAATGTTVYLINAAAQADIIAAINGGSFTASTAGVLGSALTANTKGAIATTTATHASLTAGTAYDFAVLVIDTTSVAGKTYYNISGSINMPAYDPTDSEYSEVSAVPFGGTHFTAGTGWTEAVPEPTSGVLLLLGLAGLALRRRRA